MSDPFENAEIIAAITFQDLLDDGVFHQNVVFEEESIDFDPLCKEAGIKWPVAFSSAVVEEVVVPDEKACSMGESVTGRLWDVLTTLRNGIRTSPPGNRIEFEVIATRNGEHQSFKLKAICGPKALDDPEPWIAVMLEEEE